jgi:outer membrane receptor for ferrienterochelin and colicins
MYKAMLSVTALGVFTLQAADLNIAPLTVTTTSLGQQQDLEDVQASVEVLDQKVIQAISARNVAQLLNEAAGLNVKDSGSTSSVSIRGFSDGHTLILVDGLRRTGKYGHSDLQGIALEDIERIEIVRGPMSALYGADALAGVVNIITKKAVKQNRTTLDIMGAMAQNGEREGGIARFSTNIGGETVSHALSAELKQRGDYREDEDAVATDLRSESKQFVSYANTIALGDDTLQTRLEFFRQNDEGTYYTGADTYEKERRYQASGVYNHTGEDYLLDANFGYGYSDTDVNRGCLRSRTS